MQSTPPLYFLTQLLSTCKIHERSKGTIKMTKMNIKLEVVVKITAQIKHKKQRKKSPVLVKLNILCHILLGYRCRSVGHLSLSSCYSVYTL